MSLACPVCRLEMQSVNFAGVNLDVCPECAGIWFDERELAELAKASPGAMETVEALYKPELEQLHAPPHSKRCPRCDSLLETFNYAYDAPVKVDSCPKCHGVFVEDSELVAVHRAIQQKDRAHVTRIMAARATLLGRPEPDDTQDTSKEVSGLVQALAHWRERTGSEAP